MHRLLTWLWRRYCCAALCAALLCAVLKQHISLQNRRGTADCRNIYEEVGCAGLRVWNENCYMPHVTCDLRPATQNNTRNRLRERWELRTPPKKHMFQPNNETAGLVSGPHPVTQRINENQAILEFPGESWYQHRTQNMQHVCARKTQQYSSSSIISYHTAWVREQHECAVAAMIHQVFWYCCVYQNPVNNKKR